LQTITKYSWVIVLILFILTEIIIDPIGEFPLNDDWAYAHSIYDYLNTGTIHFSFWQGFPDLAQFFTGIFISNIFGFSFTTLRFISIISLAFIIFIFHLNLKELKIKRELHFPMLLVLVFNPLTLSLANTFLSDIFQLLLILIVFQFTLLYLNRKKSIYLALFIIISVITTLNRQIGIVLPLIFGIIFFLRSEKNKKNLFISILPFFINLAAILLYEHFGKLYDLVPGNYYIQLNNIIHTFTDPKLSSLAAISYYFITSTICLGLFMLPFTISNIRSHLIEIRNSKPAKFIFIIYLVVILAKVLFSGPVLPFVGNIFYHLGTGPIIMTGYNTDDPASLSIVAKIVWEILNIVGGISFYMAFFSIIKTRRQMNFAGSFLILLFLFYLLPLCFSYANDRYLLVILPFFIAGYFSSTTIQVRKLNFIIPFTILFCFAVAGTHDYLNINRGRLKATTHLMKELKIEVNRIDGGFEFNGWHLADPEKNYDSSHKGRWWWIDKDDFIISPAAKEGCSTESEYVLNTWMPGNINTIYVLQKEKN
jgi:hypothetical protein